MGTIIHLADRDPRTRRDSDGHGAIVASAYGFAVGGRTVAWQAVYEIWGCQEAVGANGAAFLEFVVSDARIVVGERQPGFATLEAAACAVFPAITGWRAHVARAASAATRSLLFRRA